MGREVAQWFEPGMVHFLSKQDKGESEDTTGVNSLLPGLKLERPVFTTTPLTWA